MRGDFGRVRGKSGKLTREWKPATLSWKRSGWHSAQIQQTLEAAKQENKAAYFEFTFAEPHEDVKELIRRKAARLGVLAEIVW